MGMVRATSVFSFRDTIGNGVGAHLHGPRGSSAVHHHNVAIAFKQDCDFRGRPIRFADIAAHYVRYELGDQSKVMIPRSHTTVSNYKRNLSKRIVPRWGKKPALSITTLDIENWLLSLRKEGLANQTCARLKAIMSLVYAHA
jgi:hypothetical protein